MTAQAITQAKTVEENRANALFSFDNSYARDLDGMYLRVSPAHVAAPRLIAFNPSSRRSWTFNQGLLKMNWPPFFSGNAIPDRR